MVRNPRVVLMCGLLLAAGSLALGGGIAPVAGLSAGPGPWFSARTG